MLPKTLLAGLLISVSFVGYTPTTAKSHHSEAENSAEVRDSDDSSGGVSNASDAGSSERAAPAADQKPAPAMLRGTLRDQGASIVPHVQFTDPKRFATSGSTGAEERHRRYDAGIFDSGGNSSKSYYRGSGSAWSSSPVYSGGANSTTLKGSAKGASLSGEAKSTLLNGSAKSSLYKAFVLMNCQEFTMLNANYYSADRNYKFVSNRFASAGAFDPLQPEVPVQVGKTALRVRMCLPGLRSSSVQLYTDGRHLIAVDPNTNDTWHWQQSSPKGVGSGCWSKLTHIKK